MITASHSQVVFFIMYNSLCVYEKTRLHLKVTNNNKIKAKKPDTFMYLCMHRNTVITKIVINVRTTKTITYVQQSNHNTPNKKRLVDWMKLPTNKSLKKNPEKN